MVAVSVSRSQPVFHATFFGGTEADFAPTGGAVFGDTETRRPTLANELLHIKTPERRKR